MSSDPKLRILMVDDEINMLESMGDILRDEGYFVATASSGKEALSTLDRDSNFDLVITDLKMPGMTGMSCCRKLWNIIPISR